MVLQTKKIDCLKIYKTTAKVKKFIAGKTGRKHNCSGGESKRPHLTRTGTITIGYRDGITHLHNMEMPWGLQIYKIPIKVLLPFENI